MRITLKQLESMVNNLNRSANRPTVSHCRSSDNSNRMISNIGHYRVSQGCGSARVEEIINEGGGIRVLCNGSKRELYTFLTGCFVGLDVNNRFGE